MATLIAHSPEPATRTFVHKLAAALGNQRGVTTAVEEFPIAGRYLDNVDAIIVVAEAHDETFHHAARNFMAAHFAEISETSFFVAALGTAAHLTKNQLAAIEAFHPRDTGYFRTDGLDATALNDWVAQINTRGAV